MTYDALYRQRRQTEDFLQLDTVSQSGKVAGLIEKRLPTVRIGQESLRLSFNVFNLEVLDAVRTMAMHFVESTLATVVKDVADAYEALREQLGAALSRGEALRDISAKVLRIFDEPDRAFRIATTEASRAMHAGQVYVAKVNGVETKEWLASSDACDFCKSLDGKEVGIDEPFYVHSGGNRAYRKIMAPPAHPHCCLGETTIVTANLVSAVRSYYEGPIVRITFEDGTDLAVTPNHMLLGDGGWIQAKLLGNSDYVLRACFAEVLPLPSVKDPNENNGPARADEIFRSLCESGGVTTCSVPVSAEYLHGDAAFCDGQIDVVTVNRKLWRDGDARFGEPNRHLSFIPGNDLGVRLIGGCDLSPVLRGLCFAADGIVGSGGILGSLIRGELGVSDKLGFSSTADREAKAAKASRDGSSTTSKLLRHCEDAIAGGVVRLKVVGVQFDTFRGHVFDFSTAESSYLCGNGIISSNCMCSVTFG